MPNSSGVAVDDGDEKVNAHEMNLPVLIGKTAEGRAKHLDLSLVHTLLFTGESGTGKSSSLHAALCGIIRHRGPRDVKIIVIDSMGTEFFAYGELPHLIVPIIGESRKVPFAIKWASVEVEKRLRLLQKVRAKSVAQYNAEAEKNPADAYLPKSVPEIVIVIDDIDVSWIDIKEAEEDFWLAVRKGRAAGVHFLMAARTGTCFARFPECLRCHLTIGKDSEVRGVFDFESISVRREMVSAEQIDDAVQNCCRDGAVDFENMLAQRLSCREATAVDR